MCTEGSGEDLEKRQTRAGRRQTSLACQVLALPPHCHASGRCQSHAACPIERQPEQPLTHLPALQMAKPPLHCSPEHFDRGHKECGPWRQEVLASVGGGLYQTQACPPDSEAGASVPSYLSRLTEPPGSKALTSLGLCRRRGCRRLGQWGNRGRGFQMMEEEGASPGPGPPVAQLHPSAHSCTINTHPWSHPCGCFTSSMCALACTHVATRLPNKCTCGACAHTFTCVHA